MRKFKRSQEPEFLASNWEKWGQDWEARRAGNHKSAFHWHQINEVPVNQLLLPILKNQTQDHCSFCDNYPVSPPSIDTIEHFRPKTRFPREAYHWTNLYFCCMYCQQKGDKFDEALLQPDAIDYEFDRYFRWDYTRGTIEVNEQASSCDQNRAYVTIMHYRLNEGHPHLRLRAMRARAKSKEESINDFAYRNFID